MSLKGNALNELVQKLTRQALRETLGPLREDEREEQERLEAELKKLKPIKKPKKAKRDSDLDEAEDEDEEKEKPEEEQEPTEKPNVVSKKLATGKEEPKAPEAVIPDASDVKDVTLDQVITLMNMMRSGKSAKDPNTKQSLKDYFKGLNPGEKQALFVLLSGLTQILAGGVEGQTAPDPSQVGIKIRPRRAGENQPTTKGKGIPRSPSIAKPTSAAAAAEPVPIVVGEASDRRRELHILSKLRRDK